MDGQLREKEACGSLVSGMEARGVGGVWCRCPMVSASFPRHPLWWAARGETQPGMARRDQRGFARPSITGLKRDARGERGSPRLASCCAKTDFRDGLIALAMP